MTIPEGVIYSEASKKFHDKNTLKTMPRKFHDVWIKHRKEFQNNQEVIKKHLKINGRSATGLG